MTKPMPNKDADPTNEHGKNAHEYFKKMNDADTKNPSKEELLANLTRPAEADNTSIPKPPKSRELKIAKWLETHGEYYSRYPNETIYANTLVTAMRTIAADLASIQEQVNDLAKKGDKPK